MVSKQRNRTRRPGRQDGTITPRRRILVVCEGEVTEPSYIKGFEKSCRNSRVDVEISKEHGVPRTLVEVAKGLKLDAEDQAGREEDPNILYDEVWCVMDVDEHPKLDEAMSMATGNDIQVALSNPCFELWLLLHFQESPGAQHRHELQKLMRKHISGYNKHLEFSAFKDHYDAARNRVFRMQKQSDEADESNRNPTTGVYRMTESIARKDS